MVARTLMFQGTGSDVGKSLLVAGIARALTRRGLKVLPFKPQNMSNNAAVTDDGGEIGRAQALQARAAGIRPSVHMNPVLLKPQSDIGAQVIVQGKVLGSAKASEFQSYKQALMGRVLESYNILKEQADIVLVEGAGSASEVNLRSHDIANMGFAQEVQCPVILIGDIDRGGVIASLVGTQAVLSSEDNQLIKGFIVNKFRGDPSLFMKGIDIIQDRTGWSFMGLVPHFKNAQKLPDEDAVALQNKKNKETHEKIKIAVLILPHISNFDDLDPLDAEENIEIIFLRPHDVLPTDIKLVILPGSKATIKDLTILKETGFDIDLKAHARRGGFILGICGGYQMLGNDINDPEGMEGSPSHVQGLGLLDVSTVMSSEKRLIAVSGKSFDGEPLQGYEMHIGKTTGVDCERAFASLYSNELKNAALYDGARSQNGRIFGTYIHGLFSNDQQRKAWLNRLGTTSSLFNYETSIDAVLDEFALLLEKHLNMDQLLKLAF